MKAGLIFSPMKFHGIPKGIRSQVNVEFQRWILDHISARRSFALEKTLRSEVTFEQAQLAPEHGFRTVMYFVTPGSAEQCVPNQGSGVPWRALGLGESGTRNIS